MAACRVFFVHRHGIHAHPVIDRVRCGEVLAALGLELRVDGGCASSNVEPAGQRALGDETAINAGGHHLPNAGEALIKRAF